MNANRWSKFGIACAALFVLTHCKEEEKKSGGAENPIINPSPVATGSGGTTGSTVSGPAKTKDECNSANQAWIAVVNGGQSPATCGGPLSNWGCCKGAIVARFPTLAQDLGNRIDQNINEGYQLYNCSSDSEKVHKIHFARFPGGGKTEYRELSVDAFAYTPKTDENCPKLPTVNFPDPAQYAGSTSGGTGGSTPSPSPSSSGGTGTSLTFSRDINPIIKVECASAGCHGVAGASSTVYEDNESAFKQDAAKIKDRINRAQGQDGVMPKTRALSKADRDAMIDFLGN